MVFCSRWKKIQKWSRRAKTKPEANLISLKRAIDFLDTRKTMLVSEIWLMIFLFVL